MHSKASAVVMEYYEENKVGDPQFSYSVASILSRLHTTEFHW